MPSAYSTLVSYVYSLAEETGFLPEKEMLRIPSTRNACVVGRKMESGLSLERRRKRDRSNEGIGNEIGDLDIGADEERAVVVRELITRELGLPIDEVRRNWIEKARLIAGKKGDGH